MVYKSIMKEDFVMCSCGELEPLSLPLFSTPFWLLPPAVSPRCFDSEPGPIIPAHKSHSADGKSEHVKSSSLGKGGIWS